MLQDTHHKTSLLQSNSPREKMDVLDLVPLAREIGPSLVAYVEGLLESQHGQIPHSVMIPERECCSHAKSLS
jgi:hypothetical protein